MLVVDGAARLDPHERVDGGDGQRHVRHVRGERRERRVGVVGVEVPAERLGVEPVGRHQRGIGLHVRVVRRELLVRHGAARGQGTGLEAGAHTHLERRQPVDGARAGHEPPAHRGGDHVGRATAPGDHPVHLVARGELLAEQAEGHLGDRHRIERVHPFPGGGRGMGLLALEEDVEVGHGEAGAGQTLDRPGVDHHGGVDAVEGATVQHEDFAATPLLGGRAEDPDMQAWPDRDSSAVGMS